jgi:ABC-2 type transport system permease protein
MLSKVLAVAKKEFVEVMREPATVLIVLLFFPLSTMLLFGYALKFEVENIGLAVLDKDGSERSRRLVDEIKDEKDFVVFGGIAEEEVRAKIDGGEIEAAV